MEASRDIITVPGARGHEYVRVSNGGIRTKLGIDATVPFEERERFSRCQFAPVDVRPSDLTFDNEVLRARLREE
jgi:2,5-furandicarboxylate decarboxylase 1